ncbi:MAG: hypothetical protein JWQ04_1299 [Pedosphaera sp.]|nr:hypothetical protein [Pedosphaera sp.]
MGASGWNYFTPYQEDVEQALQSLRNEVFENRAYGEERRKPSDFDLLPPERKWAFEGVHDTEPEIEDDGFSSIEELLEEAAEDGTHSILDIQRTATGPDFAVAWPAPEEALKNVFGSSKPTHEQIAEKDFELIEALDLERWQAVFLTVYKDGKPSEIYFEGVSGD